MQFGLVHISAGDLLRAEVAAGTDAGKEAASYMDSGNLVPNSVVVEMVVHRLSQPDVQEHGWLLDGYPRSGDQAEAIVQEGIKPDLFVLISVCFLLDAVWSNGQDAWPLACQNALQPCCRFSCVSWLQLS